jgi:hypothetical protein
MKDDSNLHKVDSLNGLDLNKPVVVDDRSGLIPTFLTRTSCGVGGVRHVTPPASPIARANPLHSSTRSPTLKPPDSRPARPLRAADDPWQHEPRAGEGLPGVLAPRDGAQLLLVPRGAADVHKMRMQASADDVIDVVVCVHAVG